VRPGRLPFPSHRVIPAERAAARESRDLDGTVHWALRWLQVPDRTLRSVRDDTVGGGAREICRPGCGTVEIEGSCGRLGDLHFIKIPGDQTPAPVFLRAGASHSPPPSPLLSFGAGAADSRHSHLRNSPAARRPCGRRGRGPPTRSRRRSVAGHRETPILPTSVGGPEPSHPQERMGGAYQLLVLVSRKKFIGVRASGTPHPQPLPTRGRGEIGRAMGCGLRPDLLYGRVALGRSLHYPCGRGPWGAARNLGGTR
jgi:hypothetical protein